MSPQDGQILMIRSRLEAMPVHTIDPCLLQGDIEFLLAEVERRRERVAALEAALNAQPCDCREFPPRPGERYEVFTCERCNALSGGANALKAAIAEATRELREERGRKEKLWDEVRPLLKDLEFDGRAEVDLAEWLVIHESDLEAGNDE